MQLNSCGTRARSPVWQLVLWLGLAASASLLPLPARAQTLPDFTELVEKVGPAVVNIRTTERMRAGARGGAAPEMDEDMLEFFKRFGLPIPNQPTPRTPRSAPDRSAPEGEPQQRGVGSGFVLRSGRGRPTGGGGQPDIRSRRREH